MSNKGTKFNIEIPEALIKSCVKKLKNYKAVGNDSICQEMLKNAKFTELAKMLKAIYGDIINEGLILDNYNILIITPIEIRC